MLTAIASDPDQTITGLPLLTPDDQRQILISGFGAAQDFPRDRLVHQLVEQQAFNNPQSPALIQRGSYEVQDRRDISLSYDELNKKANRLAHYLRSRGVVPGSLVGVLMQRTPDMIVVLLSILKAGGAYLPIDPAYPAARIAFMLEDAAPRLVVTQSSLGDGFEDLTTPDRQVRPGLAFDCLILAGKSAGSY